MKKTIFMASLLITMLLFLNSCTLFGNKDKDNNKNSGNEQEAASGENDNLDEDGYYDPNGWVIAK